MYRRFETWRGWRALRWVSGHVRYRRERKTWVRAEPGRPTLLAINHFIGHELAALRDHSTLEEHVQVLPVHHWNLFTKGYWHFPAWAWMDQVPFDDPRMEGPRRRARRWAGALLDDITAHVDLRGVLTPSDMYWWIREFLLEANERGIKTIVYDKEGTVGPASYDHVSSWIRRMFPPIAQRYYVWSPRQKEFWIERGAAAGAIEVLGPLRTDLYVNMPEPHQKGILYFGFDPVNFLGHVPEEARAGLPPNWGYLKREIHEVLFAAARSHPDVPFTFKLHPHQTDVEFVRARVKAQRLPNVRVVTDTARTDLLLAQHSMTLGFQTTALMEAGLTSRPAVYCGWGEMHDALCRHLVPLFEEGYGTHWCQSADQLRSWIEGHLDGTWAPEPPSRDRLREYLWKADGRVARRYEKMLLEDLGVAPASSNRSVADANAAALRSSTP